jgi:hypothetical protein
MEDWIARATNSTKDHIQKDAAVAKDTLRFNRWIASSALQKALRRGDIELAQRAAFALHHDDRSATWRRLFVSFYGGRGGTRAIETISHAEAMGLRDKLTAAIDKLAANP